MKHIARASILYFTLVFVYKLFAPNINVPDNYDYEYWVNSYWLMTSLYFLLVFGIVKKFCIELTHKRIIISVAVYWGIMAALRLYLFFNIKLYIKLISSANTFTIGVITIVLIFIYLTAKICHRK